MKYVKLLSGILGISMFLFGVLKFIDPFKAWYGIQVKESGLSQIHYIAGIAAEIIIGTILIITLIFWKYQSIKRIAFSIIGSSVVIILMMIMAGYVHLQPNVPARVLPLQIKPPIIPFIFIILAFINILFTLKLKSEDQGLIAQL